MAYFVYVYSPSDFITTPPDEVSAQAAGTPIFTLTLKPGATGTRIEVNDDDSIFDEVDGDQTLATGVNLDGTVYTAGTSVQTSYDLINTATGHKLTSIHFDGDGYQQGPVHGMVSTVPLVPGLDYTFDVERTSHTQPNAYDDYVACFCTGTVIETANGPVVVESLKAGDLIQTADDGLQPLSWVGSRTVQGAGAFAPVRLQQGYLGLARDLWVSQQHRILFEGLQTQLMFASDGAFIAAKHLCDGQNAKIVELPEVTYFHLMFAQHQVVFANGIASESFLPELAGLYGLGTDAMTELTTLFPELHPDVQAANPVAAARVCLRRHEALALLAG